MMPGKIIVISVLYFLIINITASLLAVSDKRKAQKNKWRIPEAALMLIGLLGGAFGEYITMKKIRHKTKHIKFMIGLPLEILFHIVIIVLIVYKLMQ